MSQRPYGRCSLALAKPRDEKPEVPHGLRAGVQSVHHVAGECSFAADKAAGIARAMHGENGHDQVQPKLFVKVLWLEAEETLVQGAHPYTVNADEPGSL